MKDRISHLLPCLVLCVGLHFGLELAQGSTSSPPRTADAKWTAIERHDSVRTYECPAEDDCRVDYRADRFGRGVWVIHWDARH